VHFRRFGACGEPFGAIPAVPLHGGMDDSDALVLAHLALVDRCARRFRDWGEPHDDLVQAGAIGLIQAARRYDAERGVPFVAYAVPTVVGAMRRHLRDNGAAVRLPRRVHDLRPRALSASGELAQELGRAPTSAEVATRVGASPGDIADALTALPSTQPLHPGSDAPRAGEPFESRVELRVDLLPHLELLPDIEQSVLRLRFFGGLTQERVAGELGISQMQVSRLQARALRRLRRRLARSGLFAVEVADAARVEDADQDGDGRSGEHPGDGLVPLAGRSLREAPGHAELEQLAEDQRAAGPGVPQQDPSGAPAEERGVQQEEGRGGPRQVESLGREGRDLYDRQDDERPCLREDEQGSDAERHGNHTIGRHATNLAVIKVT
jgi:RNA polymerase sigma-B factor